MKACAIAALVLVFGCSEPPGAETSTTSAPVLESNGIWENGIWENGLTTNGIWENGIWENGIWENGIWENGIWENGIWENGVVSNGIWENGIWENGIWENGIWENGIWENGIWENGIWENGIWENGVFVERDNWRSDQLRTNPYTRQLLQYVYSCAMPASAGGYSTEIMIGPADARVTLTGSVGIAINEDNTAAWETGRCDQSCQRWISACVLARTNAYGVNVQISMRAPDTAPQRVKDALAVTSGEEADQFTLREGGFYGNIFEVEPLTRAVDETVFVSKPELFACAGPGSNIPEVTKRFSSSQGDNSVIQVSNVCTTSATQTGACTGLSNGTVYNCRAGEKEYGEVITVYLRELIAVCGNAVCEGAETDSCPSDCHPGSWARSIAGSINSNTSSQSAMLLNAAELSHASPDGSFIMAGNTNQPIDVGTGPLPPQSYTLDLVIAKYTDEGAPVWARRIGHMYTGTFAVGPDGRIYVQVTTFDNPTTFDVDEAGYRLLQFSPDGDLLATWDFTLGENLPGGIQRIAIGIDGDVYLTNGLFVAKFPASVTTPAPTWLTTLPAGSWQSNIAVDAQGNVAIAQKGNGESSHLVKLNALGEIVWTKDWELERVYPQAVAIDASGVYVTGAVRWDYDLGGGAVFQPSQLGYFVAKYDLDGNYVWDQRCLGSTTCGGHGQRLAFAGDGSLIVSGLFGGPGAAPRFDLGVGRFDSYATTDAFIASYTTANTLPAGTRRLRWAKQLPAALDGNYFGLDVTSTGRIVTAGFFSGSLAVDDRVVISRRPELPYFWDTFVASFRTPSANDVTPPVITTAHMPKSITVQATAPNGALVFFMPPTATDSGFAGTNVACTPSSFSTFAIGTTTVTCVATDPAGNASTATFTVTVIDTRAPLFVSGPSDMTVPATSPSGASVTYDDPVFRDQADASVTVNCVPASNTVFPIGATQVVCLATDDRANTAEHHFTVTVTDPGFDTTPPFVTVPAPMTVEATGPAGASVTFAATSNEGTPSCDHASASMFPLGTTTVTCSATDAANNTGSASFTITVQDTIAPAIVVPAPINVTSATPLAVSYSATAVDIVSGAIQPTCTAASGSVFALGVTTVTCTAIDAAHNSASASFTVTVTAPPPPPPPQSYSWSGVLQPINADGSSIFKLNSTVAVKFKLTGASAGITNLVATLSVSKVGNAIEGTVVEAVSNGQADTGNQFRYDASTDQYVFNLSTKTMTAGTWLLHINLPDGAIREVEISLKK